MLTPEARVSALRMKLADNLEAIVRESVKPMERIESIKILHVDGLGGSGGNGNGGGDAGGGGFSDSVVNSALRYRAQAPLIDQMLKEIGVNTGDLGKLAGSMAEAPVSLPNKE
jgi:uncharacterized membrane protein YqiK